jgi:hypothetical protein
VLATIAQKQRFNLGCERGSELVNLVDNSCLDFDISSPPRDYIAMSSRRSELNEAICFAPTLSSRPALSIAVTLLYAAKIFN